MILTPLQQAQRVVGAAYARRFAHPSALGLIQSLEHKNAILRDLIVQKEQFLRIRSEWFVFFRAMPGVLSAFAIALALSWFFYSTGGACLQGGLQQGHADARHHKPLGAVVSDACRQNQDPMLARFRGPGARIGSDAPSALHGGARRP